MDTHKTHTIPAIAPSLLHSSLSSFSLSCFKSCWTGLGLSLVSVWYSALAVMAMTSHPYPMVCYIPTRGDSETPEVYRTAQQRLRGHLRRSHIQASRAFYVPSLVGGFYGKTLTILSSLLWGKMGEREEGDVGDWRGCECHRGLGSIHLTGDSHHTWFLVKTAGRNS